MERRLSAGRKRGYVSSGVDEDFGDVQVTAKTGQVERCQAIVVGRVGVDAGGEGGGDVGEAAVKGGKPERALCGAALLSNGHVESAGRAVNKKGVLWTPFYLWRTRHDSNVRPPSS